MSKSRFDHLLSLVKDKLKEEETNMRKPISPGERLLITLRYLCTGMSHQALCYSFRVGKQTVSNIIKETCDALYDVLQPVYMNAPSCIEDWKRISDEFELLWDMPHTIGAIDGKHIAIDCPHNTGSLYHNYKGFFSIVLLAVCDARYCFTLVDVGQYGSSNDSGVLNESSIGNIFKSGQISSPPYEKLPGCTYERLPYFLVGDEIFPLKDWLMRPYPGKNMTEEERIFNYRLSRARRVIENASGILVARWRILRGFIRAAVHNVEKYVLATLCLHNYLRQTDNAGYCPTGFVDSEDSSGRIKPGEWRSLVADDGCRPLCRPHNTRYGENAKEIRDALKYYVNSEQGAVPWQLKHVRRTECEK